jgi:hypothetical protein
VPASVMRLKCCAVVPQVLSDWVFRITGSTGPVGKKRLERELRALAVRHEQLEEAHRRLSLHVEVIALALRSPDHVPQSDLEDAITGVHELNGSAGGR